MRLLYPWRSNLCSARWVVRGMLMTVDFRIIQLRNFAYRHMSSMLSSSVIMACMIEWWMFRMFLLSWVISPTCLSCQVLYQSKLLSSISSAYLSNFQPFSHTMHLLRMRVALLELKDDLSFDNLRLPRRVCWPKLDGDQKNKSFNIFQWAHTAGVAFACYLALYSARLVI